MRAFSSLTLLRAATTAFAPSFQHCNQYQQRTVLHQLAASRSSRSSLSSSSKHNIGETAAAVAAAAAANAISDKATVKEIQLVLSEPSAGSCRVTLIGTAHISRASNEQVERIIKASRPDVVAIELDETRLQRIGFESMADVGISDIVTAVDIVVPMKEQAQQQPWWNLPQVAATNVLLNVFSTVARKLLTSMYNDMSDKVDSEAGGEFAAAIEACKKYGVARLVLADRDSTETIRRAAELAIQSGDPFGALGRMYQVNEDEMVKLEEKLRKDLKKAGSQADDTAISVQVMESLKQDKGLRTRLFDRLEKEVPEFTQAFIKERDYIMAEAIRREVNLGAKHIVGVVGLAHVPGMIKNLREGAAG